MELLPRPWVHKIVIDNNKVTYDGTELSDKDAQEVRSKFERDQEMHRKIREESEKNQ